jgi:hypothetical protein
MMEWFETNISEIISFFSGVIVTVFAFVVGPSILEKIQSRSEKAEMTEKDVVSTEDSYRHGLVEVLQKEHLSGQFFALDEIAVKPMFVLPDSKLFPTLKEDLNEQTVSKRWIPFIPTAINGISMISDQLIGFEGILREKQRLLVHGEAGVGKSFALAWLALELTKENDAFGRLTGKVPFYFQAGAVIDYLDGLNDAEEDKVPPFYLNADSTAYRRFFRQCVDTNRAIFFVDSVDELNYEDQRRVFNWLETNEFIGKHAPLLVSTGNSKLPDVEKLGMFPVALAKLDENRARAFLTQWSGLWQKFVADESFGEAMLDLVQNEWLVDGLNVIKPLDLTLRTMAIYLNDIVSPYTTDILKAFVYREFEGNPMAVRILSAMAVRLHAKHQLWFKQSEFEEVYQGLVKTASEDSTSIHVPRVKVFLESGLFVSAKNARTESYRFIHQEFLAFLISESEEITDVIAGLPADWSQWEIPLEVLRVSMQHSSAKDAISKILSASKSYSQKELLDVFSLLPNIKPSSMLFGALLKNIQNSLRSLSLSKIHKYKLLDALVPVGRKYTKNVFYPMMKSADAFQQRLAILGCGFNKDKKAAKAIHSVGMQNHGVNYDAASLALSLISSVESIDLLAKYLLTENFRLQKTAAEALGLNASQGHAILKEGLGLETLSVRRACCYGLAHIHEDWSIETLKNLEINDLEWIVQSAASSTLEFLAKPKFVFGSYELMHNIPWLIEFASQYEVGVSAGESSNKMMFDAVVKGKENFAKAALQYYFYHPSDFTPYADKLATLIEKSNHDEFLQARFYDLLWQNETVL